MTSKIRYLASALVLIATLNSAAADGYNAAEAVTARTKRMKEVCYKYSDPRKIEYLGLMGKRVGTPEQYKPVYMFGPPGIAFRICIPNKVASNSWKILLGTQNMQFHRADKEGDPNPSDPKVTGRKQKSALLVRHPLERLLSSYLFIFRDSSIHRDLTEKLRTFWLGQRKDKMEPVGIEDKVDSSDKHATLSFRQFINFLTKCPSEETDCRVWVSEGLAHHWHPYWSYCAACYYDYDYVLELSHVKDDKEYIFDQLGFNNTIPLTKENETRAGKPTTMEDKIKYFGQASKQEIYDLYLKYRMDHEMFGFSPDEYIALGKDNHAADDSCSGKTCKP